LGTIGRLCNALYNNTGTSVRVSALMTIALIIFIIVSALIKGDLL